MPQNKSSDYMLDVAAGHKYRNQTEEYSERYHEWRTDPSNRYGYNYVHDTRIRTYVDGEGYVEDTPAETEKKALMNCYRLTATTLLLMSVVAAVRYIVMWLAFDLPGGGRSYYSDIGSSERISDGAAYALLLLNILEYLLPIFFLKAFTRMPSKIAVPLKKSRISALSSIMMMLVIMCIGKLFNSLCSYLFSFAKMDIPYYDYILAGNTSTALICGLGQHVLLAVLIEILFRGYMLQLFRQFGDTFAVVATSFASCFMLYDLTQMMYIFCVGIFTGIITIRSGSIKNACIMRVIARFVNYILTFSTFVIGTHGSHIVQIVFCLIIFSGAIFVYMRINTRRRWSFDTSSAGSYLTMGEKLRMVTGSVSFWGWAVLSFVLSILMVRIL
ncbi:MAG: CPBP family intramembrane metalloprotease [Ruminococcus sp.]|nr:CPBP family intramembrane metalloprotease [Ruminococcus sp.]